MREYRVFAGPHVYIAKIARLVSQNHVIETKFVLAFTSFSQLINVYVAGSIHHLIYFVSVSNDPIINLFQNFSLNWNLKKIFGINSSRDH